MARLQHPLIMLQFRARKISLLRLNTRPLDGKAVRVEAKIREHVDVLLVEMVVVAGVAGSFAEHGLTEVLDQPQITVEVVALDLMRGGSQRPTESLGEFVRTGRRSVLCVLNRGAQKFRYAPNGRKTCR